LKRTPPDRSPDTQPASSNFLELSYFIRVLSRRIFRWKINRRFGGTSMKQAYCPASCWFLVRFTLLPWRQKWYVSSRTSADLYRSPRRHTS
jgi:hypothetical protein